MATSSDDGIRTVMREGKQYMEATEGLARILVPATAASSASSKESPNNAQELQKVFYNPIQQFNRDLSVLAIKAYGEERLSQNRSMKARLVAKRKRERSDTGAQESKKLGHALDTDLPESIGGGCTATNYPEAHGANGKEHAHPSPATPAPDDPNIWENVAGGPGSNASRPAGDVDSSLKDTGSSSQTSSRDFSILDALSATGLRALRYAQELPFVTSVTANDLTPSAVEAIRLNAEHNGVDTKVRVTHGDARVHMYSILSEEVIKDHAKTKNQRKGTSKRSARYDVIDLDPYGTAAPFLDAAVNAVRDDGGLLCVTCTDSGVWASHGYPEKAFALYGGIPAKGFHSHEAGLRLVLHGLATTASRYGLAIEPLLSLSIDYYLRIFVTVKKSPSHVKFLAGKTMVVYNCDQGCGAWQTQTIVRNKKVPDKSEKSMFYKHSLAVAPTAPMYCEHCGFKTHLAGPMYGGPLHSPDFIKQILEGLPDAPHEVYGTKARIEGMLQTALEEFMPGPEDGQAGARDDSAAALEPYPFYFHLSRLAGAMHCACPDENSVRGALRHLGYRVTRSHCKPGSLKTNAPWSVIWHIMREWVRQESPVKTENIVENSAAYTLLRLGKETVCEDGSIDGRKDTLTDKLEVFFDRNLGRDTTRKGLVRYQVNPRDNWGPLSKARDH